jgi:hypothetical protein
MCIKKFLFSALAVALLLLSIDARAQDESSQETDFAWLSIAPEIGYTYFFEAPLDVGFDDFAIGDRHGFVAKAHVDIGGDGLALELAPFYAFESGSGPFGDFDVIGGEIHMVYRFSAQNVFPSIGIGFHGAVILANDYIESGTQLYARLPLGLTWYFAEYLGLVVEAGLMYGGTGVRAKEGTGDTRLEAIAGELEFGANFAFDLMVGIRFP